jgi:hypothetical protein
VVGVAASLLGVTGDEFLIPTLVLLFGADIKLAGSLSLAVSLSTMLVGLTRYPGSTFRGGARQLGIPAGDGGRINRRGCESSPLHHGTTRAQAIPQHRAREKLQLRGGAFAREPVGEPHLPQIALVAQDRPAMAGLSQLPTNQLV